MDYGGGSTRVTAWALWLVGIVYVGFAAIYFYGLDGADDYYWVNHDFFQTELQIVLAIVALVVLFICIQDYQRYSPRTRSLGSFRPFLIVAGLTVGFWLWAFALMWLSYLTDAG